ncbi:hypothetical protein GTO89_12050 [Heliobacterium gestii]|uniref:Uncharacterized protein n=1 Tax=Heliomicrobium gestii TaxID=2699 RepID=A0A845LLN8_HELGE|nr:hypothetical protein [Heliomicrobium gestii]MBM7867221.1 hypothetical protein [Heliomicrobium gestii]MZP43776.1 hypothetical protein [Heliomicrobium gestii]
MGNYHLAGTEYVTSDPREEILGVALAAFIGRQGILTLKTGQHTAIWRSACTMDAVIRREERIEEGHLTVEQVAFQLLPRTIQPAWEITLPVDQFIEMESYPRETNLHFQGYTWSWRPQ